MGVDAGADEDEGEHVYEDEEASASMPRWALNRKP